MKKKYVSLFALTICLIIISIVSCSSFHPKMSQTNKKTKTNKVNKNNTFENQTFYYEGNDYTYVLSPDLKETISFKNPDGSILPVLSGAGNFQILDKNSTLVSDNINPVIDFDIKNKNTLVVHYQSLHTNAKESTTYTFYENRMEVSALIKFDQPRKDVIQSYFTRNFINNYIDYKHRVTSEWQFPENNDFPYQSFHSYVLTNDIDSRHKLYTFRYDQDANPKTLFDYYPKDSLLVFPTENSFKEYEIKCSYVFENLDVDKNPDYLALFKGRGEQLALFIEPLVEKSNHSTLFEQKDIPFDINVTSLADSSIDLSLSYRIYDYYGNTCVSKTYDEQISSYNEMNIPLDFSNEKSGIYYLDVSLSYNGYQYRELYPFGILPEKKQHSDTSPFGISGVRFGSYQPNDDTVALLSQLGAKNTRICISLPDYVGTDYTILKKYLSLLQENKIDVTGQFLLDSNWKIPENPESYVAELTNVLDAVAPYLTYLEVGNENNMYKDIYPTLDEAMSAYMERQFLPCAPLVQNTYHLPLLNSGVYLSLSDWLNASLTSGLWEKIDVLSTHAYSFPHSPDYSKDANLDISFESACVRVSEFLANNGDKPWHLSEFGLPTTPNNTTGVFSGSDLRSQADYTIREFILGLSYGADTLQSYSLFDQLNTAYAMNDNDLEYHFGMFYNVDYYGRIMPKPLALAFASLTNQLSYIKNCEDVSSQFASDTIRAFEIELSNQTAPMYLLWSNCAPLSNDNGDGYRTPNLPWENQWSSFEEVTLKPKDTITVTDIMGNNTTYNGNKNTIKIPVTGSPILISNIDID